MLYLVFNILHIYIYKLWIEKDQICNVNVTVQLINKQLFRCVGDACQKNNVFLLISDIVIFDSCDDLFEYTSTRYYSYFTPFFVLFIYLLTTSNYNTY